MEMYEDPMDDVQEEEEHADHSKIKTLKNESGTKDEDIEDCDKRIAINEDAVQHISGYTEEETMKWINEFEM
jgi:hypothetical protein